MSNTGFTIGYNCILRDQSLSLATKGLYLVVSSYIGMPEWKLTKNTLNKICGTAYAVEKAWKELLAAGYLKHYTARAASGAFIHRYELMQEPSASAPHAFVTDADFVSGDCRIVLSGESKRDFTQIPNSILRSKRIPLAVKGLFGVVAHLINIPDFSLNPAGVRAFCMERIKRFSSIWRQLKLTGLLKQHRYPTGEENSFEYQYELLDQPDSEAPYLVNHHADSSVSSERTISDYIAQASAKIKRLFGADGSQPPRKRRKNAVRKSSGLTKNTPPMPYDERIKDIRAQIDADTLELHYAQGNVEMAVEALAELKYEKDIKIKNNDIPLEDRQAVVARVARPNISHFLSEKENVLARSTQNSVAYCRTVLYDYLIQQQAKDDAQPQQSDIIPLWEEIWLKQKEEIKKRRKAEEAKQSEQSVSEPVKA